ncbi:MAG: hypothetical protein HKP61_21925 [Dactylosporangium sp.]|nr:hypothetical protein [Dactylosporangium sp.]NNJ63539.1 hypothetical protein [Dactylosporangium sp.]
MYDLTDYRHLLRRVKDLNTGDRVFTAAYRWETVTRIEEEERPYAVWVRVFTDLTGQAYAWRLDNHNEVPTVPAYPHPDQARVHVDDHRERIVVFVGTRRPYYRDRGAVVLAEAIHAGRGRGWKVADHAGGGDPVCTTVASKAAAMTLVRHAARAHAQALGLRVHHPEVTR